ncbi:MAG: STAS domain-containing protein [Candidatus Omnitrophica bacterium]|nr:STAS domain-containing protein [Candidatus Omnitrophota bacterium]
MSLKVVINKREFGVFDVSCIGPVDTSTYETLEKEVKPVLDMFPKVIVLNMEGVNYISSMGISAIIKIKKSLDETKGSLIVTNLQPQVKKVFDVIKALPTGGIFTSIAEVDAYLDRIQREELEKGEGS